MAMKIISNCLEINVQDVQMFRSVAYFMLELGLYNEAIVIFRRIQDKAPAEPHSFMDLGLALFMNVRKLLKEGSSVQELKAPFQEAITQIAKVIVGEWVARFYEIEWPNFIWLNWIVNFGIAKGFGDMWPEHLVTRTFQITNLKLDLVVTMGWDTDWTDIDLHVYEPSGNHVYYGNRGTKLSRDFTQGYGPESYTIKSLEEGLYKVDANYFGSAQVSKSTGTTSCVLWCVKYLGNYDSMKREDGFDDVEQIQFHLCRLDRNASSKTVMLIDTFS